MRRAIAIVTLAVFALLTAYFEYYSWTALQGALKYESVRSVILADVYALGVAAGAWTLLRLATRGR